MLPFTTLDTSQPTAEKTSLAFNLATSRQNAYMNTNAI